MDGKDAATTRLGGFSCPQDAAAYFGKPGDRRNAAQVCESETAAGARVAANSRPAAFEVHDQEPAMLCNPSILFP